MYATTVELLLVSFGLLSWAFCLVQVKFFIIYLIVVTSSNEQYE